MSQAEPGTDAEVYRTLDCPVCGEPMALEPVRGIRVDVCEDHGMWLDQGELELIQVRGSGKNRGKRRENLKEAKRKGRVQGWLFGWASFLMPD